uniref:Uncharacterized protein n=1 Tax=Bursaphelenchus xylophilus TaxID=6326 RepID=A0A1I7SSE8_BURXY
MNGGIRLLKKPPVERSNRYSICDTAGGGRQRMTPLTCVPTLLRDQAQSNAGIFTLDVEKASARRRSHLCPCYRDPTISIYSVG